MDLKEKLLELRKKLVIIKEKETEKVNAILKDHPIDDCDIYRLYYINYHKTGGDNFGTFYYPLEPFKLPKNMTREEGLKVLSYLTDCIEARDDVDECSIKSVNMLDDMLEKYGFTRVDEDSKNYIHLFTVTGIVPLFKQSKLYQYYFEWYIKNVTLDEILKIYSKYNMDFKNPIWINENNYESMKPKNSSFILF